MTVRLFKQKHILIFILVTMVFLICLKLPMDPDMGWHLQDGQLILANKGIPATDPYSYTMPDFPVIFHEWLTDIIMWLIYYRLGLLVLSVVFAAITFLAFITVARSIPARFEYQILAALLGAIASIPIIGARPQMITLLGLAMIIYIFYRFKNNPRSKIIYWLPLIFLFWVNLHGGFVIGLFILGLFLGLELLRHWLSRFIKKFSITIMAWRDWLKLAILTVGSALVTLLNPYGYKIYEEIYRTFFDCTYARQNILEWLPLKFFQLNATQFIIYLILFVILLLVAWRKIDFSYLIVTIIFGVLAFTSWRNVPLFILVSIPFWVYFVKNLTGQTLVKFMRSKWTIVVLLICLFLLGQQKYNELVPHTKSVVELAKKAHYPIELTQWLADNPQEGNVFNEYNWGGFLIWQLPEQKFFIDGRMACWEQNDIEIFRMHQRALRQEESWPEVFDQFDIKWAILGKNDLIGAVLVSQGWQEIYADDLAKILRKE